MQLSSEFLVTQSLDEDVEDELFDDVKDELLFVDVEDELLFDDIGKDEILLDQELFEKL